MEDAARSKKPSALSSSPWQEAHMDILGMVFHRANSLPFIARAAAVCRAWRRAVEHLHPPLPPPLPWLLLPDLKLMCSSLSSYGSTHRLPQPDDGAHPVCIGSTADGRVILLKDEQSCFFLNPLSGATSPLPDVHRADKSQTTFSAFGFGYEATYPNSSQMRKAVMSSSPGSGMIAGIQGNATLFLYRPGAASWSLIKVTRLPAGSKSDIAFHNGKLYLFHTNGYSQSPQLLAFDIREDAHGVLRVTLAKPFPGPPSLHGDGAVPVVDKTFYYLTESGGRLLVVKRELSKERWGLSYVERRTRAVTVFALDESTGRPEWERMESLGGEIMFLSATSSVPVPSSRYPGSRGDCIYFGQEEMDVMLEGCPSGKGVWHCPHHHCEVFDMRTRMAERVCTGTTPSYKTWRHGPTWFVPSHQPKHANAN